MESARYDVNLAVNIDRPQNIIICGHNPLVGFKNQKVKEKKSKIVIKGGIEVCSVELYSLLDEVIKPRGDNFYYLCADIHNYQKGIVTINNMTIQQHIVGIGGTELDADYDGNYISLTQDEEDIIKKSKSVKEAKTILEEIQKNPGRKLSNITLQIPNMSVSYTLEEHWSDYGYLVVTIQDDGTINFLAKKLQIKEIEELENGPLEDQLIAMGHASGGKRTKRRKKLTKKQNKRSKIRNKHTKKNKRTRRNNK